MVKITYKSDVSEDYVCRDWPSIGEWTTLHLKDEHNTDRVIHCGNVHSVDYWQTEL